MTNTETIKSLNENERKALAIICKDCDDIEGEGFTTTVDAIVALMGEFENGQSVGGYLADLMDKGLIAYDKVDNTLWVDKEVFAAFC